MVLGRELTMGITLNEFLAKVAAPQSAYMSRRVQRHLKQIMRAKKVHMHRRSAARYSRQIAAGQLSVYNFITKRMEKQT